MKATKSQIQSINRLSSQAVFDSLRATKDLRWVATGFVVQALPGGSAGEYGLCVSASKRMASRAVDRNRMRRRLGAIALDVIPRLAKPGMNYMISARSVALTRTSADLERDLCWCLKKLNLLK